MRTNSLAFRLVASACAWSVFALAVGGLILSSLFEESVERIFDARLADEMDNLLASVEIDDGMLRLKREVVDTQFDTQFDRAFSGLYWQVMEQGEGDQEQVLLRSRSLRIDESEDVPEESLPLFLAPRDGVMRHSNESGPADQNVRILYRGVVLPGAERLFTFAVAADRAKVMREIEAFNATLWWSMVLMTGGLAAAILLMVRIGLSPLDHVREALAAVRAGRTKRLGGNFPAEIAPLAEEVNSLLDHNQDIVERARTHVGNLAHGLKTPLAILSNEAHAHPGEFAAVVERQSDVMCERIDRYLSRARTAAASKVLGIRADVEPVVIDISRTLNQINRNRDLALTYDIERGLAFRGERQDLEEMAGNLIENAFKWAQREIRVRAVGLGEALKLIVEDDGPGLSEEQCERVLKRGIRLDETVPGSGLGLSIVNDMAQAYRGTLVLSRSNLGGLSAELTLPEAPKAA